MSLSSGSRLGPFEITGALGAGGMGEVYRARDTKLNRDVAIKVLPDSFALDPDRLARFKREAQVLASLAHPNIAAVFGFDEVNDRHFLVLELVEGENLDKRIARGPIPADEAIAIAKQVADALEAAHERGVVHRDLKPANVAISGGGQIKVLDFGLAKALVGDGSAEHAALMTNSPTLTSPVGMTGVGVLLGTAPYMSPEQARGKTVDKRSDIWAFGCVLYEMLAGRRAFGGEDVSVTLAEIIRGEVDWTALPAQVPPGIRSILQRCLQKDVRQRFRDIGDVRLALDGAFDSPARQNAQPVVPAARWRRVLPWAAAIILSVGTGVFVRILTATTAPNLPITRFTVMSGPQGLTDLTISPDGRSLAYVSAGQLFLRPIDRVDAVPLPGLGTIRDSFFSPDGEWVGYFTPASVMRKVPVSGGPSSPITGSEGNSRGATWGPDGTIVFATGAASGLLRVSAGGGNPSVLTTPDPAQNEMDHIWPHLLPDGRTVLFTILMPDSFTSGHIAAVDIATGSRKVLVRGATFGRYVPTGHLVFARSGTLQAVAFDPERVEVMGEAVTILERVATFGTGRAHVAVSNNGTLVYVPGEATEGQPRTLTWVDRSGNEQPVGGATKSYSVPRVSKDGARIVAQTDADIFVFDIRKKVTFPLTFGQMRDIRPMWSPNGGRVLFRSDDANGPAIYSQAADGSGSRERLVSAPGDGAPNAMTPDGKTLVYSVVDQSTGRDLWVLNLETRETRPLVVKPGNQGNAAISPDGRWIAYHDETEGGHIYVHPFPAVERSTWRLPDAGNKWPVWSPDRKELFYVSTPGPTMMAVPVDLSGTTFTWGTARRLFQSNYAAFFGLSGPRNYDVAPDGRFLVIEEGSNEGAAEPIVVVQNWQEELKRLVPRK